MKLGEALSVRARQAQKMEDLRNRIKANATKQGDQETPENAKNLLDELIKMSTQHAKLVLSINQANAKTTNSGGITLLELLMQREDLNRKRSAYQMTANAASQETGRFSFRYTKSELPTVPTVDVEQLRENADQVTSEIAKLDAEIQTINWNTDI